MRIATWNVNSLKVRLPHVETWLRENRPDVLCLQETKVPDDAFPVAQIEQSGYRVAYCGQPTYNGVAVLSRTDEPLEIITDLPGLEDSQRRLLGTTIKGVRVLNVYVPNGQEVGSEKFAYKLRWLEALIGYVQAQLSRYPNLVLLGDFNVAPEDRDVHDPEAWRGKVLCSEPERAMFERLCRAGLADTYRKFTQDSGMFSWWDYRAAAFRRDLGLRIDHVLASPALLSACTACAIDKIPRKWDRPSDHTPVVADFDI